MKKNDNPTIYVRSESFIKLLEKTSEELRSWPAWKRNMLGPALPEDRAAYREFINKT